MKPIIAISMGDPGGIGPEVIVKALANTASTKTMIPLVIGDEEILRRTAESLGLSLDILPISSFDQFSKSNDSLQVLNSSAGSAPFSPGSSNALYGDLSFNYVQTAVQLCLKNQVDAVVTAPICKESWQMAGHKFDGHTELLAHLTGVKQFKMMFASETLNVILTTTHLPLLDVSQSITIESVYETIVLGYEELKRLGIDAPKIAVCGLNPHAGESGIFGHEEKESITPAIEKAITEGIDASGPFPADTIFIKAVKGEYDLVVAQYHDQGLIPVKLLAFDKAVNITIGLPVIRTSVDHGTAFDIAGKGIADPENMIHALDYARKLTASKS